MAGLYQAGHFFLVDQNMISIIMTQIRVNLN